MNQDDWVQWRKSLISQNGSLYVNIPKTWVIINGLKKGDQIRVKLLNDGSLKIIPGKREGIQ